MKSMFRSVTADSEDNIATTNSATGTRSGCTGIKHGAAIMLNNMAISSFLRRGHYEEAIVTMQDAIQLIKSCISDCNGPTTESDTEQQQQRMTVRDIDNLLLDGYEREAAAMPPPTCTQERGRNYVSASSDTTCTTDIESSPRRLRNDVSPVAIQVISDPCYPVSISTVLESTTSSSSESPVDSSSVAPVTSPDVAQESSTSIPKYVVLPIRIDDDPVPLESNTTGPIINPSDIKSTYEYHSVVFLYNYGLIYQCMGLENYHSIIQNSMINENVHKSTASDNTFDSVSLSLRASYRVLSITYTWLYEQIQPLRLLEILNGNLSNTLDQDDMLTTVTASTTDTTSTDQYSDSLSATEIQETLLFATDAIQNSKIINRYLYIMIHIIDHILQVLQIQGIFHPTTGTLRGRPAERIQDEYEYYCTIQKQIQVLLTCLHINHTICNVGTSLASAA